MLIYTKSVLSTPGTKGRGGHGIFVAADGDSVVRLFLADGGFIESKFFDGPNQMDRISVIDHQVVSGSAKVFILDGPYA
jgi:hypothetical protein